MLVLVVMLSSCSWRWVAQQHASHGHVQGSDRHHTADSYKREAALYTSFWRGANSIPNEANWDRVAHCESTGNWSINTGNGYYGGLQFSMSTWRAYGGIGYPHQNSKREQIIVAERVRTQSGLGHWPSCGSRF